MADSPPEEELESEPDIHSFIVRIWLEEREAETHRLFLRGHITYVLTGERQYFQALNEIPDFINSRLSMNGES